MTEESESVRVGVLTEGVYNFVTFHLVLKHCRLDFSSTALVLFPEVTYSWKKILQGIVYLGNRSSKADIMSAGCKTVECWFDSRKGRGIFLFLETSIPTLRATSFCQRVHLLTDGLCHV